MMPLYQTGVFDYPVAMALATLLGIGFGFVLERAGFGRANVLVAQFHGTDMRVLKVMFSAVATVAVGLGLFGGLGIVDLGAIQIPETWVGPHIVGGLLVGIGFVVSGYCPGTSLVAAGSGHIDGLYAIGGVMVGSLLFGFAYPLIDGFYASGGLGVQTFPDLLGVPWPVVAAAVAAMAVGAFLLAERIERPLALKNGLEPPAGSPTTRNRVLFGLMAAAAVALVTVIVPGPAPNARPSVAGDLPPLPAISSVELASGLAANPRDYYVVDIRSTKICAGERIPGAMCLDDGDPEGRFMAALAATRTLVVYGAGPADEVPAAAREYPGRTRVLTGGYAAFKRMVLTAPTPPVSATAEALAEYRTRAALHGYFTGSKQDLAPVMVRPRAVKRAIKKGGGC